MNRSRKVTKIPVASSTANKRAEVGSGATKDVAEGVGYRVPAVPGSPEHDGEAAGDVQRPARGDVVLVGHAVGIGYGTGVEQ